MSVIQSIRNLASAGGLSSRSNSAPGLKPYLEVPGTSSLDFRRARSGLLSLYRSLEQLAEIANVTSRFKLDLPDARSTDSLALDLTTTAATLASTEEINASPMSFSPFGPAWDNGSNALITIGGEYDGTHGSGTLSFEVRRDGTHGVDNLRIRLRDPQGSRIDDLDIRANHLEDRQYSLSNGLYLTLGPGSLIDNDTTTIQVFDNVGAVVNPDQPLAGIRNSNPNLQFGGPSIINGSFSVNGENISVSTSDSLNDVVNRINQSAAGVSASFNVMQERIEFLQDAFGSVPTIDLQNDTSNFLQATKLDSATVIAGIDPETEQALDNVALFSAVQSGNLLINGQQISVDTATDSLDSIVDRINASSSGAVASFDTATRKLLIEASDAESVLELDSNGTGLFAALKIPEGRVDPEAISRGVSRKRSYDIADAVAASFKDLNYLFRDSSFVGQGQNAGVFRAPLDSVISGFVSDKNADLFGLLLDNSSDAKRLGRIADIDRRELTQNLQLRGDRVQDTLGGTNEHNGLIEKLLAATRQSLSIVNRQLGISGSVIDTFA